MNRLKKNIKQLLLVSVILSLLIFLLLCPVQGLQAARTGLGLWLNTLIPTLLPFLILTDLLLKTTVIEKLLSPFSWIWKHLFGLSPMGAYGFFTGILCGYPMGAKTAVRLYEEGKISRREAHYLLAFSNNASPAFIRSYLAVGCLHNKTSAVEIIKVFLLADLFCMLFFRFVIYHNHTVSVFSAVKSTNDFNQKKTSTVRSLGASIDVSIMNSFETITRLGGYILLFSLITAMTVQIRTSYPFIQNVLCAALEITSGLHILEQSEIPYQIQYLCSMAITASGGMCILLQTKSILKDTLSVRPYLGGKCINTLATVLIILLSKF